MTEETAHAEAAQAEPVPAEAEQAVTADEPVVAKEQPTPRVSRRKFLAYGATATGALAVGGFVGAAVQREIYDAQIPPTITPQALLDDASRPTLYGPRCHLRRVVPDVDPEVISSPDSPHRRR